jgi:uncharacterized protein YwgA/O-acetyl-ADP-ribose deacetylase (regulator of RNase III)
MGKGIAAEFKKRFPKMFKDYIERCENKEISPGVPYLYKESFLMPQIINFPTKNHWRAASKIEDIEKGMRILTEKYKEWDIKSIAIPPLGCGNGQLLWEAVGPIIYKYVSKWDIPVKMYAPYGTPAAQLTPEYLLNNIQTKRVSNNSRVLTKIKSSWLVLVEIIYRIEQQRYHVPVGRTIFQKIVYVATSLGLPTELDYIKGSYGPYSRELKEVKKKLANAGLIQEKKLGQMFRVFPGLQYNNIRKKRIEDINEWDDVINKTADLFLRLNTKQAELVATVLFVVNETNNNTEITEQDILKKVMQWKQKRRPPLDEKEVAETIRNLGSLNWINVKPSEKLPVPEYEEVY